MAALTGGDRVCLQDVSQPGPASSGQGGAPPRRLHSNLGPTATCLLYLHDLGAERTSTGSPRRRG